jgi:flagellin
VLRAVELAAGGNSSASEFSSVIGLATAAAGKATGVTVTWATISDAASAATALSSIATGRATVAATMATAQSNANLYGIEYENKTAMKSNIMDADMGAEVVNLTKWQILSQAGTSALTNANTASQTVLGLLR